MIDTRKINIFLLAHQDDEFGVFWQIYKLCKLNEKVVIFYLTSGHLDGQPAVRRNDESLKVLTDLGVNTSDIYFLGCDLNIPDGKLVQYLNVIYQALLNLIKTIGTPIRFYLLAWEGGHQDHDAAHLIGVMLAKELHVLEQSYQFPLYTGERLPSIFFKLFSPLDSNGPVVKEHIPWHLRGRFITYCFYYRSQKKAWIGLFPFFLCRYLFCGDQYLQKVALSRIVEPPHIGKLLYDRRGFYRQSQFKDEAIAFIKSLDSELIK